MTIPTLKGKPVHSPQQTHAHGLLESVHFDVCLFFSGLDAGYLD